MVAFFWLGVGYLGSWVLAAVARIVVVGSGFAGVEAVRRLHRLGLCDGNECIWVTANSKLVFLPLLPALVSRRYRPEDVEWGVEGYARRLGVELVARRVVAVEPGRMRLEDSEVLEFDYAVVAAGARPAFYGVPGAEELSVTVYSAGEAWRLGEMIEQGRIRSMVVVGAGFVGVEVAAEALWLARRLGRELRVTLVDMLEEPLQLLGNRKASKLTREILEELGAGFEMGRPVTRVYEGGVELKDGTRVEGDVVVWSAGLRGPGIEAPREALARGGFFQVDEYLRVQGLGGRVYAAGDAMAFRRGDCVSLKMAREALRSASRAVENIAARLRGRSEQPYKPLITSCRPMAGVGLGPDRGVLILGKKLAFRSTLVHWYHEKLRRSYERLLRGG
ncbi:NAD(P)/FAD-dependent oxidoreductase [Pyrodictium abyssi]|uniref:NAD(P)/FAD-dependent oxidoreductase n=1 Tax=Pyrodictium abyssi TaxID=54256 RepID=UPI0030C74BAF